MWPSLKIGHFFLKFRGLFYFACLLFLFVEAGLFTGHRNPGPRDTDRSGQYRWVPRTSYLKYFSRTRSRSVVTEHPIPKLMEEAEVKFSKLLSKQSKTLAEAVNEYKRRYKKNPPKAFDEWFAFAQENNVKLVDEYDGLMEDLAPFWDLSGSEVRRRVTQVALLPSIDVVRIEGGKAIGINLNQGSEDQGVGGRAKGFMEMIAKFCRKLPDMDFPINTKAEGRVLVPWEQRQFTNISELDSSGGFESILGQSVTPDWRGMGNVWESFRRICPLQSPARRLFSSYRNSSASISLNPDSDAAFADDFVFAAGTDIDFDFCEQPWAHYDQGHFFSDWRTVPGLYPVFSPSKTTGFLDIRIPSHYYYGSTGRYTYGWDAVNLELKDVDDMEIPWEDKIDRIFWRGATTGGGSSPPGFTRNYQRHRFVRMANEVDGRNRTIVFAESPTSSSFTSTSVSAGQLNSEIMDVAFVSAVGQYPGGKEALMKEHRFADAVPLGKHWAYKYLVDLDGMAYSGRYMSLLASDSAVIKSTVYREYYTDWIQPWLHFIPLSSSYGEIYNIHSFFSGPTLSTLVAANMTTTKDVGPNAKSTDGDRRLRRIARAGKQWKRTIGRTIDMEVYVYRLCLEYARLWADVRDSMDFTL